MQFTPKQSGVAKGMLLGLCAALLLVAAGFYMGPTITADDTELGFRSSILGGVVLLPAIALVVAIGRLARHRFITPADIDGGGLTSGSGKARVLQSLLQNTLEQFCIAFAAYTAWCYTMPVSSMGVPVLCSIAFLVGRVLFFVSYEKGAAARALGFTLTFYPTVVMVIILVLSLFWRIIS